MRTLEEVAASLTGYEEIAVEQHLGIDVYADAERKPVKIMRALVFIQEMREGKAAGEAKKTAMTMPLTELQASFSDEKEPMPSEPISESGKD